jgi:hypothetical protein
MSNSNSIKKLGNDVFRIKINVQLRSIGVKDLLIDNEHFDIVADQYSLTVEHNYDVEELIDLAYDELLDPIHDLSAYIVKKIINYLYSVWGEIDTILKYLKWKYEKQ